MSTENTKNDHQPEGLGAMTGSAFWVLFEHMSQEHGLTLLDSELSDICHAVDRMREKWKADEAKSAAAKANGAKGGRPRQEVAPERTDGGCTPIVPDDSPCLLNAKLSGSEGGKD